MEKIYDLTEEDLKGQLIGKRIVEINEEDGEITLDDGTTLQIEDTVDCCAWFEGALKKIDLTENAITDVSIEHVSKDDPEDYDEHWKLVVLSADKAVCAIEIDGNAASGYYCHSINLIVRKPVA